MRKIVLGVVAAAALATPLVLASSANAATTCQDVPTTTGTATFHATQPSGGGGNWNHTFTVDIKSDGSFAGANVITGLDAGHMTTVNETVIGQITDKNNDSIKEVTLAAHRDTGLYTFNWSVIDAPMNGKIDSMTDGAITYASAENWNGGPLPITFTAPEFATTQVCTTTTDPVVDKANHGEYVSGAAHAGIKGKELAAIAKNTSLVGPYKG